jgi:anti-sigma B factor antagonist
MTNATTVSFSADHHGDVVVLRLTGELDMASAPELLERVEDALAAGDTRVLVDLTELSFCDSAGLNAFIRGDRRCTGAGGWLRLTGASGHVARVLAISGLTDLLTYRPDAAS